MPTTWYQRLPRRQQASYRASDGVDRVELSDAAVLAVRPAQAGSELHGLYERAPGAQAVLRVWMRTARERRVVAFRTFLRTLLHEPCHHLDCEYLRLADSLHTPGFFRRESSLFRQLVPGPQVPRVPSRPAPRSAPERAARELRQMRLVPGAEPGSGKAPA